MVRLHVEEQRREHRHGLLPRDAADVGLVHQQLLEALELGRLAQHVLAHVEVPAEALGVPLELARRRHLLALELDAAQERQVDVPHPVQQLARRGLPGCDAERGRQRRPHRRQEALPLLLGHDLLPLVVGIKLGARLLKRRVLTVALAFGGALLPAPALEVLAHGGPEACPKFFLRAPQDGALHVTPIAPPDASLWPGASQPPEAPSPPP